MSCPTLVNFSWTLFCFWDYSLDLFVFRDSMSHEEAQKRLEIKDNICRQCKNQQTMRKWTSPVWGPIFVSGHFFYEKLTQWACFWLFCISTLYKLKLCVYKVKNKFCWAGPHSKFPLVVISDIMRCSSVVSESGKSGIGFHKPLSGSFTVLCSKPMKLHICMAFFCPLSEALDNYIYFLIQMKFINLMNTITSQ